VHFLLVVIDSVFSTIAIIDWKDESEVTHCDVLSGTLCIPVLSNFVIHTYTCPVRAPGAVVFC